MHLLTSRKRTWAALVVGLSGVVVALSLPFAPVFAETTTITWPEPGQLAVSSTAIVVPYRPSDLTATIPCSALRAGDVAVLATGDSGDGLVVTGGAASARLQLGNREIDLAAPADRPDCRLTIRAGAEGVAVTEPDGQERLLAGEPVPEVFGFRTGLDPPQTEGMSVTATLNGPFVTTPTPLKVALVIAQLLLAGCALLLLRRRRPRRVVLRRRRRLWWIDGAVIAMFCGWAVIGPLSVDDGWASMIARTYAATGDPGNYYRWWNAAEVPFALGQQLLAPLTQLTIAPLWLRVPSILAGVATWFVLSRGVLGAALPAAAGVRILAAVCLLMAWLPFNLGTRPEALVALGVSVALALAWRARSLAGLGWLALVVALTIAVSPNGALVAVPILVFAPRLWAVLRAEAAGRLPLVALVALLSCVAAVGFTVIFADQTWDALLTATDWHRFFGPTLSWYEEPLRYEYLLQSDQQGSFAKRLPVLLSIAMVPIVGLLVARRRDRDRIGRAALRLGTVVVVSLLLFALSPSKWSYHFGAAAGFFGAFLAVSVVLLLRRARAPDRYLLAVGAVGALLLAGTAALAFDGPNAWWLPALYDVAWSTSPVRPFELPLNNPLLWAGLAVATVVLCAMLRRDRRALIVAPAVVALAAMGVALAVLVGSFVAAPMRRGSGSLAVANLERIAGQPGCGLAEDVEVLPDGDVLASAEAGGELTGFAALRGFPPDASPPDPPGVRTSAFLWGSYAPGAQATGSVTTQWFALPALARNDGVAVSVSGRTADGNSLVFEFGQTGEAVSVVGELGPADQPAADEDVDRPLWRTIGVDAADIPPGTDRMRIRATDARSDPSGWLAFTGPRLRSAIPLRTFLADYRPVLISWPQSFVFPCLPDVVAVTGRLGQTPRAVIESPRPRETQDRDADLGGTFAALEIFGELYEVPSRLVGHPDVDWGAVLVSADTATLDSYRRDTTRRVVPGIGGVRGQQPER